VERYGIVRDDATPQPQGDELVRDLAAVSSGSKSSGRLLHPAGDGEGVSAWNSVANQYHDPDMFVVGPDGVVNGGCTTCATLPAKVLPG